MHCAVDSAAPVVDALLIERVREVWHGFVDQGRIVGGMLLLAQQGEVRYASARGWADREAGIRVERHTRFRLASLTKLVTSVCVLRLCEQGFLALDAPVSRWLPEFQTRLADGSPASPTLRHLLSHTAGLGYGFEQGFEQGAGNPYQLAGVSDGLDQVSFDQAENLRRLASVPLFFVPGSAWRYSLATDVLGAVIESATGLALPEAIEQWVTRPLGMQATGFEGGQQPLAAAYKDGSPQPLRIVTSDTLLLESGVARISANRQAYSSGGAGLLGTADDYLRLLECLRTGGQPLLSQSSTHSLLNNAIGEVMIESRGAGWKFGLGTMLLTDPLLAGQAQGAGSWSWCGVHGCHYWVDPLAQISLVALTNTAVAGAWGEFADALVAAVYGGAT